MRGRGIVSAVLVLSSVAGGGPWACSSQSSDTPATPASAEANAPEMPDSDGATDALANDDDGGESSEDDAASSPATTLGEDAVASGVDATLQGVASADDASVEIATDADDANTEDAPPWYDGNLPADRFITGVVSFTPGPCAGFGQSEMPGIVEGPPVGGGSERGSTDVVSLGNGGSIVVTFGPNAIVDGPGVDFIVFENPFWVGGNSNDIYAEPGEVSVSEDGVNWSTFPCNPTPDPQSPYGTGVAPPYGQCAGWHVVYSAPGNGISPVDPAAAGGDAFDLADIGVTQAQYVRIVDRTNENCPESGTGPDTNGFDLDAIAIVNAANP
jgi:hypothetical protein